ncbi:MAG: hypothetical protein IH587_05830 [Anaerolineae bacterium]|nr:hypothetical protein [Anaerolineae bacterium]
MQPIVNGLQEQYGTQVEFHELNALDGAEGERLFDQLALPGHPSVLIYAADGQRVYWGIGLVDGQQLQSEITQLLAKSKIYR